MERIQTRGVGGIFSIALAVSTLLLSCPYHQPRFKSCLSKVEGGRDLSLFNFRKKIFVADMAPKKLSRSLPTGWTFENEVMRDGSRISYYYCKGTGQQFYTYDDLMRYVEYAKEAKLGIYSLKCKSRKRRKRERKDSTATVPRKKSSLSDRKKKPSSYSKLKSSTDDQSIYSNSSSESKSTDKEEDPDYMPVSESSGKADSQSSETEHETEQVSTAENNDLESDDGSSS